MTEVVFRPEAEADLMAIALHVSESSAQRAADLLARLRKKCGILRTLPYAGRVRHELGDGLRSLSERPYIILYRVADPGVEIVAIVHGARDLPAALVTRFETDAE